MSNGKPGRRVVVTGLGVVTPIGQNVPEFWASLKAGQSGVSPLEGFPIDDLKILIAAQIKNFDPKQRLILERIAETCPVARSLHPDVVQELSFSYR